MSLFYSLSFLLTITLMHGWCTISKFDFISPHKVQVLGTGNLVLMKYGTRIFICPYYVVVQGIAIFHSCAIQLLYLNILYYVHDIHYKVLSIDTMVSIFLGLK